MSNYSENKKRIKSEIQSIRRILNTWDPIPWSPEDEYDCLVHRIISGLHSGIEKPIELAKLITAELNNHFGLHSSESDVRDIAETISEYWTVHKPEN